MCSVGAAAAYKMLKGWLKYTGTLTLERSLPIESLIIDQTLNLIFGSLRYGSSFLSSGSSSPSLVYIIFLQLLLVVKASSWPSASIESHASWNSASSLSLFFDSSPLPLTIFLILLRIFWNSLNYSSEHFFKTSKFSLNSFSIGKYY